jgi:hypothetical protein
VSDELAAYLHDHLAGSNFAIELLKNLREQHAGEPLSEFATELQGEIEADRYALQQIIDRAGSHGSRVKEAATWIGEKISRLKLSPASTGHAGTFESLELLALGITGKLSLWRALAVIAASEARVRGPNYDALATRAQDQYARVEARRLEAAAIAFTPAPQ